LSAKALLEELRERGVELVVDGELLLYRPKTLVSGELLERLKRHKAGVRKALEWERRKLEDADRRGFVARRSKYPGWISLHDPLIGEWHDFPTADCFPSIVAEANKRRTEGGIA
jgi:TubC N-terminal docking domain